MDKVKGLLGSTKSKAAIFAAFFSALYLSLPMIKPHLPDWLFVSLSFIAKCASVFFGGI